MKSAFRLTAPVLFLLCCLPALVVAAENSSDTDPDRITGPIGATLEDFFTAAINYSPELKIAEENLNIGSARRRAANGRLLPQLRANGSISDNNRNESGIEDQFRGERYSITLTQTLFNWQNFAARKAAYLIEDQREAEYYSALSLLLTSVAERYFNVLQADDAL